MATPAPAPATAPATSPAIIACTAIADDQSIQFYVRVSAAVSTRIETLRAATLSTDPAELHQQAIVLQRLLPSHLSTWALTGLPGHELVACLHAERDEARSERDDHMTGEGRLHQGLADAEVIMNRLACSAEPATAPQSTSRAEKIADPDRIDGARDKLKVFKDQLMLKTSGNAARFLNSQHKLRYAYQFLTGKAQRTMRIHRQQSMDDRGEETFEILFDSFAAFLAALDHHFGDPDEKHTAAVALDKLCQANREFGVYYADFQELMDILETTDDTSWCHALKHGLNHEMLNTLAIYPTPKDESFDEYVERLNELDCRLRALATHTHNQYRLQAPRTLTPTATAAATPATAGTATGTAAGPMDLSAARGKLTPAERQCRRTQGLCMYCGGVGHFASECPARRSGAAGTSGRRALVGVRATMTPASDSDSESGNEGA